MMRIIGQDITFMDCVWEIDKSIYSYFDGPYYVSPCIVYYLDGGFVRREEFRAPHYYTHDIGYLKKLCTQKKKEFSKMYFDDEEFILHLGCSFIGEKLNKCIGKSLNVVGSEMEKYREERQQRYLDNVHASERWVEFRKKFGDWVIGIDNNIDVFPTGFSVRVLFHSDKSFEERKQFIKENMKDVVGYAIGELEDSKRVMKKIGDMRFYKPVLVSTLRAAEAEIKFEIKREIA